VLTVGPKTAPLRVALAPPAPTPTSGRATISYELSAPTHVSLTLLDVQGREVAVLERGEREAGWRATAVEAHSLRPGLYLVRLQAGHVELHRRMVIIR